MSYHLAMEKKGKEVAIEMPPLPPEVIAQPESPKELIQNQPIQEPEVHKQEAPQVQEEPKYEQEPVTPPSRNEKNIKFLREKADRADKAEQERDALLKRIQEMEYLRQNPNQHQAQQPEQVEDYNLDSDSLVEGKHLKKYDKQFRDMQEKLKSYEQQSSINNIDLRLKAKYPDLDKVVSQENLLALRQDYPELAATLNANSDLYSKAVSAYTLIKKLGLDVEDTYEEDRIRAQKNAAKPRPLASVAPQQSESPLTHANAFANGLTDTLKEQLRKEMYDARNKM